MTRVWCGNRIIELQDQDFYNNDALWIALGIELTERELAALNRYDGIVTPGYQPPETPVEKMTWQQYIAYQRHCAWHNEDVSRTG
jgi:hypothetical protein